MATSSSEFNSTWVLLRGWTREARHWRGFPHELSSALAVDATSSAEVICLDLPGAGTERHRPTPMSIREIALDVRERFMRQLNGPGSERPNSTFLVGISMGGMVALEWANLFPKECTGLVLMNSSLASLSPPWHRLRPGNLPKIGKLLLSRNREGIEREILKLTTRLRSSEIRLIAKDFAAIAQLSPVSKSTLFRQLTAASSFSPKDFPSPPSLVLSSNKDRLVDPRCSDVIAKALDSVHEVHPEAGHDLPLDDPAWVAQRIAAWYLRSYVRVV